MNISIVIVEFLVTMLHQIATSKSASLVSVISYAWILYYIKLLHLHFLDTLLYKVTPPPLLGYFTI